MFARLTRFQVRLEKIDKAENIFAESIVPAARTQKGFLHAYLLSNPKTGESVSISLWETEQDAVANEKNHYYQEQMVKLLDLFSFGPVREGYVVTVDE